MALSTRLALLLFSVCLSEKAPVLAASCALPPLQQPSNQRQQLPVRAVSARWHLETEQILLHYSTTLAQVGSFKQTHTNTPHSELEQNVFGSASVISALLASAAKTGITSCVLSGCARRDAANLRAEQSPGLRVGCVSIMCSVNLSPWIITVVHFSYGVRYIVADKNKNKNLLKVIS